MTKGKVTLALIAIGMPFYAAQAAETTTYTYDALGRLVQVVKSGAVNNGVASQYTYDKAGNRTRVKVTGSPNGNGN